MTHNGSPTPTPPPPPAPPDTEDFYVGYLPRSPRRLSRHTMIVASVHILFAAFCATVGVAFLTDPGAGQWEYGTFRDFEGVARVHPYPMIELTEPPRAGAGRTALIVGFGKHGAQDKLASFDGQAVKITGSLLERGGRTLIELAPDEHPIALITHSVDQIVPNPVSRGPATLMGEIVDPKCFLGAMKPGEGKTHKACAVRCIAGGIPPVLVTWDASGRSTYYVLTGPGGEPINQTILPFVGDAVQVTGQITKLGDLLLIAIDPAAVVRIE
jgi:hypothetical protein